MIFANITQATEALACFDPASPGTIRLPVPEGLHRSNMMLNPLRLEHLNRLDELEADVATLNLEDAIAPERKAEALRNVLFFLGRLEHTRSRIVVRINPLEAEGEREMAALRPIQGLAIRIPKVRCRSQIERALELLGEEQELHASLETKEGLRDLARWGSIDPRFTTVNLGILDLLADLGLPQSLLAIGNPTVESILARFLVDARTAGLHPVSFMYQDYRNLESFRRWCEREREMGFGSKACMGPAQARIANEIFAPSRAAIERARTIKERFEAHAAEGITGFMDEEYGFIDEPIYRDALNILATAKE
ncbi:HpcH/HpaI aldolase/citrate lyase family protein [Nitratifractor sp.]